MKKWIVMLLVIVISGSLFGDVISRSFELRYVSDDPACNGESDFKGKQEVFDLNQRLEYLKTYADYAKVFFDDPDLNKKVVSLDQARAALKKIKPQPLPQVRKRIVLNDLKAFGYKDDDKQQNKNRIAFYNSIDGASVKDGTLTISPNKKVAIDFKKQNWRMQIQWQVKISRGSDFKFKIGDAAVITSNDINSSGWTALKVELDMVNQRYNLYVNDKLIKDFVPFDNKAPEVADFEIIARSKIQIDNIWAVGYAKDYIDFEKDSHSYDIPFLIETVIDDKFDVINDVTGWTEPDFNDSQWKTIDLPYAHGGERYKDQPLYLRKKVTIDPAERVELNAECLDPSGQIWVNGEPVFVSNNRHPISVDITKFVNFGCENIIAVKVDPYKATETMRHTSSDEHIGWFAGRIHLDCTPDTYINDVFAYTESIGEKAVIKAEVMVKKDQYLRSEEREIKKFYMFDGNLTAKLYKWFPRESSKPVAEFTQPIKVRNGRNKKFVVSLDIDNPQLWSPNDCNLYKLVVELTDQDNNIVDDFPVTTGIRTVSQTGGTFRINGKPEMMNGALLFSMPAPLEIIAKWQRCAPGEYILKDLLQLKAMNANTARMSQHHSPVNSINDPRYAEYADQVGIIFQWATTSWVRTSSPWQIDFEGLTKYVKQVRNHPSIVMYQPGNHPKFVNFEEGMEWFEEIYNAIYPYDKTRLICPTANNSRLDNIRTDDGLHERLKNGQPSKLLEPIPIWTAPLITRGGMEYMTGYGAKWDKLRNWPNAKKSEVEQNWSMGDIRIDFLNSKHRAFFDFESEESAAQPNWSLRKGKPGYEVMSYEWGYDKGSVGTLLTTYQWLQSQAFQAMSAFEAYKKKRWLDYDGMAWCTLRGGGNTGTYKKPLIDYYDHAKLAFYAVKMSFQPVLACSKNVDIAYGPADNIPVAVMNIGGQRTVDVKVEVKTTSGKTVHTEMFKNIKLKPGRTCKDLQIDFTEKPDTGYYAFEYTVTEK